MSIANRARGCQVDGCTSRVHARGLCDKHYRRLLTIGHAGDAHLRRRSNPNDSFDARVEPLVWSDCLAWAGAVNLAGYGHIRVGDSEVRAHRFAWERVNGPIPEGMEIDHTCHNRSCVNTDHLRLATRHQNTFALSGARSNSTTGIRGVYRREDGTVRAQVRYHGKNYTKSFGADEIAVAAAWAAAKRASLDPEYAGGN